MNNKSVVGVGDIASNLYLDISRIFAIPIFMTIHKKYGTTFYW